MKKHIYAVTIMAILAGIYHSGCTSAAKEYDTIMKKTTFDGVQGYCTNGGVKIEVLADGVVDETQTQYICNGAQGENGQDGQDGQDGQSGQNGTQFTLQTTQFDGAQGDCTNGGVKIEVLVNGTVDDTQTQYICNGTQGENGQSGTSTSIKTTKFDGAQGDCTNGGVKIELLVNGVVDSTQTQYICNKPVVGDIITFGHYEQDNDPETGKEPIEWRVLDVNAEGQLLVISEKVLEKKRYNETNRDITWEKSTIRSWLNGYAASYNSNGVNYTSNNFIDAAFTAEEQAKIIASNVPAHKNPSYRTWPGNATTDKIFLLSIVEAKQYFANDTARLANATRYAVKQELYVRGTDTVSTSGGTYSHDETCTNIHCYVYWWLRSPGYDSYLAAYVDNNGAVFTYGYLVYNDYNGVRPALWLDY